MMLEKNIDLRIKSLKNDFTNGSSIIALNSLKIFIDAIEIYSQNENFHNIIKNVATKLIMAKPTMSSLKNIINLALEETISTKKPNPQIIFNRILYKIELSQNKTLDTAINEITKDKFDTIITCSYSSTVINLFEKLKKLNYLFKIIILETIWKQINFSINLKKECDKLGITSEIVRKDKIPIYDFAIIGVDSIIKSKGVINGMPSKLLALNSYNNHLPLYIIGESYKTGDRITIEDGFELIENKYISDIFSDNVFA